MASKSLRVTVDWSKLASRINPNDVPNLNKLKSQIDSTVTKTASLPEALPKIDWSYYKQRASNPKLVDELEKKYTSISIPPPKATSSRLDQLKRAKEQDMERFNKFAALATSYIESAGILQKKFEDMIPIKEMNYEDWTLTFPHWSSTIEDPSISPHFGRTPGLSREEAKLLDQPDVLPFSTPTAWKDWEKRKKFYE